jgi:hypothetical protein
MYSSYIYFLGSHYRIIFVVQQCISCTVYLCSRTVLLYKFSLAQRVEMVEMYFHTFLFNSVQTISKRILNITAIYWNVLDVHFSERIVSIIIYKCIYNTFIPKFSKQHGQKNTIKVFFNGIYSGLVSTVERFFRINSPKPLVLRGFRL